MALPAPGEQTIGLVMTGVRLKGGGFVPQTSALTQGTNSWSRGKLNPEQTFEFHKGEQHVPERKRLFTCRS